MVLGYAGIRFFTWGDLFWGEGMNVLIVLPKIISFKRSGEMSN
jgi:hypothetical protein